MASTNLSGSIFTDEVDLYVRRGGSISPPYSSEMTSYELQLLFFYKFIFLYDLSGNVMINARFCAL